MEFLLIFRERATLTLFVDVMRLLATVPGYDFNTDNPVFVGFIVARLVYGGVCAALGPIRARLVY